MSTVSNVHTVTGYISGKTHPLDGQRLAKITYRVDKTTGIKPESKAVSVPITSWNEIEPFLNALKPAIIDLVHDVQDKIVRAKVESGATYVHSDDLAMSAVLSYLTEESGRITGEVIRGWFQDSLRDPLMLAFASKLGIPEDAAPTAEQSNKLEKILKGYEDSFAKMASGAASFNSVQKTNLLKALQLAEENDSLAVRFTERLNKKSNDDDLLMAL